ncbi:MAG TPA: glycosyltransferase family 87 protein [Acidobacteriaceae bacterium]|nr:glycosyltransferase family 87 protein [Acidobacteriaceae bacterium]
MATSSPIQPATGKPLRPERTRLGIWLLLAIFLAASAWHLHIIDLRLPANQSDLLPRWLGTRLALHGQDPYSLQLLGPLEKDYNTPRLPFLYPAPVVILLAPLAPLSMQSARTVFFAIVTPLLALSFWLCMGNLRVAATRSNRALVLLAALLSWPVVWGLRMEQPTLLVAALLFVSWWLLARGHQFAPGLLLALTTIKPQLVLPFFLWLLLWAILQRRWTLIASFSGTLALLLLAAEKIVPGWFPRWRDSLRNYNRVEHAAPALQHFFGHGVGLPLTILLTLSAGYTLWRLRRCTADSPQFATALGIALAIPLFVVPTEPLMIYNNTLLFPAVLLLLYMKPESRLASSLRWLAFAQLALDFLLVAVAVLGETLRGPAPAWISLPFLDFLLAALLTAALTAETLSRKTIPAPAPHV